MTDYKEVRTTEHEQGKGMRLATFKATQLIWLGLVLLEAALALRLVFKLIGVNADNTFAALLYGINRSFRRTFCNTVVQPFSRWYGFGNINHSWQ